MEFDTKLKLLKAFKKLIYKDIIVDDEALDFITDYFRDQLYYLREQDERPSYLEPWSVRRDDAFREFCTEQILDLVNFNS